MKDENVGSLDPAYPGFELSTFGELVKRTGRGISPEDVQRWIKGGYIQPVSRDPNRYAPYHPFLATKLCEMETMLRWSPERIKEYCSSFKTCLSQVYHFVGRNKLKTIVAINESLLKKEDSHDLVFSQETIEAIKKEVTKNTTKAQLLIVGLQGLVESTVEQIKQVDLFRRRLEGELRFWYQTLEKVGEEGSLPNELLEITESAHARVFPRPDIEQAMDDMLFPDDRAMLTLKELEIIQEWNESIVCPECLTAYALVNVLRREAQIRAYFTSGDNFKFKCPDCDHTFDWRKHYIPPQKYSPKMKNVCQYCGNFFKPRRNIWDRQKFCGKTEECREKARSEVNRRNYLKRKALLEKSNNSEK